LSTAQLTVANNLMNWIQQSYVPGGGLGDVLKWVSPKMSPYHQDTKSLPSSYGAYAKIYFELKPGAGGKIVPATDGHYFWSIRVNAVYGEPALSLSTPEQYYFTLPTHDERATSPSESEKAVDLSQHPVLGRFPSYYENGRKYVVLARGNRLPFVKLTKGEYLDVLGAAIAYQYERERIRITEANQGDKVRIAREMVSQDERRAKRLAALAVNRERYQSRLQEVAATPSIQPSILLDQTPDVFLGAGGQRQIPVYKVDPAMAELAKTGAPQWIVVAWDSELNRPPNKRLHDAIINNFDFEFLYDYFFAPEKVKGRSYAPLRPSALARGVPSVVEGRDPAATEPVVTTAASASSKARAADSNVFFFDDFSTTPVGKPPVGWRSTLNNAGASSVVATIDGVAGHWATTSGFLLTPGQLKTPLPADFTVTYDLVASANYTWGARGMTFTLSNGAGAGFRGSFVSLKLRPGSGSADGEAELEAEFPKTQGYLSRSKWFKVPGFSDKAQATVAVMLVKQGERLQLFLNKVMVFESDKAIPAGFLFNQLSLDHQGTFDANSRMFIGNLTILKK
jgi:hypothetical protein